MSGATLSDPFEVFYKVTKKKNNYVFVHLYAGNGYLEPSVPFSYSASQMPCRRAELPAVPERCFALCVTSIYNGEAEFVA